MHIVNYNCDIPSDTSVYQDEVFTLVVKLAIIPLAVFIELLASIYAVETHFVTQIGLRWGHQCPSWKHCLLQTFHVLALWNIFIAVQLFSMVAIPISGLLIIRPQMTIFYILFFVTSLSGLIFTAASLSTTKKKAAVQSRAVREKDHSSCFDCCNPGNNNHTSCSI